MIITLENDQDKLQISEELERLLTAGLNVVAGMHGLSEQTEVDITIVDDEEIHMLNRDYRNVDRLQMSFLLHLMRKVQRNRSF